MTERGTCARTGIPLLVSVRLQEDAMSVLEYKLFFSISAWSLKFSKQSKLQYWVETKIAFTLLFVIVILMSEGQKIFVLLSAYQKYQK